MPLFMDMHSLDGGVAIGDVAKAHMADLQDAGESRRSVPALLGGRAEGKIFCLVGAPSADAANTVHREAHGLVADEIYAVPEGS